MVWTTASTEKVPMGHADKITEAVKEGLKLRRNQGRHRTGADVVLWKEYGGHKEGLKFRWRYGRHGRGAHALR